MSEPRLHGRRALVTGAGTGIGREVGLELAQRGAAVVFHFSSSREGAESAAEEVRAEGGKAIAMQADLARIEECTRLVEQAASFLEGLDVLVNNAGITEIVPFDDVTPKHFDRLFHVNIRGQFFCAQQAARNMAEQGGTIINLTSVHGLAGAPGYSVYAGTKGAIIAWTRQLAVELAPRKIRVNAVAPGWIVVPSHYARYENYSPEEGARSIPWRRTGNPSDIAKACAFLASDEADFIVGAVMLVDGGVMALIPTSG